MAPRSARTESLTLNADAWSARNLQARTSQHERLGHIARVVPVAGGDVAGEREVRKRCQGDVGRPPDPGLQHATAPDGNPGGRADVVHAPCLQVAADPPGFHVHDLTGAGHNGPECVSSRFDGLVKAHRGSAELGECGVGGEILLREWLLDEKQAEGVETEQMAQIGLSGTPCWRPPGEAVRHRTARARPGPVLRPSPAQS